MLLIDTWECQSTIGEDHNDDPEFLREEKHCLMFKIYVHLKEKSELHF